MNKGSGGLKRHLGLIEDAPGLEIGVRLIELILPEGLLAPGLADVANVKISPQFLLISFQAAGVEEGEVEGLRRGRKL